MIVMTDLELTKEEKQALSTINFDQMMPGADDVSHKIVDMMKDPMLLLQYTNLSETQVKLFARCHAIGMHCDDDIKKDFLSVFAQLQKSCNRKSLERAEEMIIAREQRKQGIMSGFKDFIFGKKNDNEA